MRASPHANFPVVAAGSQDSAGEAPFDAPDFAMAVFELGDGVDEGFYLAGTGAVAPVVESAVEGCGGACEAGTDA
jgi:hypothetical protein